MANGYFERGEIYWVRMDNGFGGEQGVGRPGLILTADLVNNKQQTLTIAFMSTKYHSAQNYIPVDATGQTSYVIVNQIMTYDKSRLGKCIGKLNSAEQKAVDDALEELFDLGYVDNAAIKEKESEIAGLNLLISEANAAVAGVNAEIEKKNEEIASLKMEIEMWQKCYGRCMDMLVDTKVNADLSRRTAAPVEPKVAAVEIEVEEVAVAEESPVEESPVKDDRLDINSCTATALKKIGFSLAMAKKIVESRPFKNLEDLKRLNGLKATQYRVMEPKLCCKPPVTKSALVEKDPGYEVEEAVGVRKVNINTATSKEIHEALGLCMATCSSITGYRKKRGPYEKLDDLLNIPAIYPGTLERFGHLIEL